MIIEGIFSLIFALVEVIINLFPQMMLVNGNYTSTFTLLNYALTWFPLDLWIIILSNIIFWLGVQGGWLVIEWVYKKVPGVD